MTMTSRSQTVLACLVTLFTASGAAIRFELSFWRTVIRQAGSVYALTYAARLVLRRLEHVARRRCSVHGGRVEARVTRVTSAIGVTTQRLESRLVKIERDCGLWKPWTIVATRFTTADNRGWWNTHDWSRLGEEWTPDVEWKAAVVGRFLVPFVPEDTVLEVGPGGGRWTEILAARSPRVYVLDVAEVPLEVCRGPFKKLRTIAYMRGDGRTVPLQDGTVDAIWSYDVFVHVNPADARYRPLD